MRNALAIIAALVAAAVLMAARPGNEFNLITQLNGQPSRWVMPDGGRSGVFTQYDGGVLNSTGCMPLSGATNSVGASVSPNVLVLVPLVPGNLCVRPSVFSPMWDGGCNAIARDENFGVPIPVNVPQYVTPDSVGGSIGSLCFTSDAGFVSLPVWTVQ